MRYLVYDPGSGHVSFSVDNPRDITMPGLRLLASDEGPERVWVDTSGDVPVVRSREPMVRSAAVEDVLLGSPVTVSGVEAGRPVLIVTPGGSVSGLLASEEGVTFTPDTVGAWAVQFIGRYSGEWAYNVVDATISRDQAVEAVVAEGEVAAAKVAQGWSAVALAMKRIEIAEYRGMTVTQQNALTVAQRAARFPFVSADAAEMGSTFNAAFARLTVEVELRLSALARVEATTARQLRDVVSNPEPLKALGHAKERLSRARRP